MGRIIRFAGVLALTLSIGCGVSTGAFALSSGRVYEMVSPVYKQGYGASQIRAVQPSGESVAFTSQGGFSGALSGGNFASHDYLARRTVSGWLTGSLEPEFGGLSDVSADLEYALASGPVGPNSGYENYASLESVFQLHSTATPDTIESWETYGNIVLKRLDEKHLLLIEEGASPDFCNVVIGHADAALLPSAETEYNEQRLYDLSRGCNGEQPSLRLVAVNNDENQTPLNRRCPDELGSGEKYAQDNGEQNAADAIDEHGDEVFFTTNVERAATSCFTGDHQVFVRLAGAKTLEISRPLEQCLSQGIVGEVPCDGATTRASAYFKGASENGSRVFFTTRAPLVDGDEDTSNDLYMATIGCPGLEPSSGQSCAPAERQVTSLVQVSHDPSVTQPAEVQGVVAVAPDGSHIYFVARGVLTSTGAIGEGVQSQPVDGADNLYVYEPDPEHNGQFKMAFITDLCSGPSRSGEAGDLRCSPEPTEEDTDIELLLSKGESQAQTTPNGAFLVFDSFGRLVIGDTDSAKDVYRYDSQTGELARVSVGEDNYQADDGNGAFDSNIHSGPMGSSHATVSLQQEMDSRAISSDGTRIVFDTAQPLSLAATNGEADIYEWHEGAVSLISSGTAEENDAEAMITTSGQDVIFRTSQGLVSQDRDGLPDIYDARMDGGFPAQPAEQQPCSGDACQGPLTNPAPLLVPGSVSQAPGGNFSAPLSKARAKPKKPDKKHKHKHKAKSKRKAKRAAKRTPGGGR